MRYACWGARIHNRDVQMSQPARGSFCENLPWSTHMGESYRDLIGWRKAMDLVTEIYRVTRSFPRDELYGLTNQLRRAAVSVPSNIAEGQARFSRKEFHHFLSHARGSLVEIETQLTIAQNLEYISPNQTRPLLDKTSELGKGTKWPDRVHKVRSLRLTSSCGRCWLLLRTEN